MAEGSDVTLRYWLRFWSVQMVLQMRSQFKGTLSGHQPEWRAVEGLAGEVSQAGRHHADWQETGWRATAASLSGAGVGSVLYVPRAQMAANLQLRPSLLGLLPPLPSWSGFLKHPQLCSCRRPASVAAALLLQVGQALPVSCLVGEQF